MSASKKAYEKGKICRRKRLRTRKYRKRKRSRRIYQCKRKSRHRRRRRKRHIGGRTGLGYVWIRYFQRGATGDAYGEVIVGINNEDLTLGDLKEILTTGGYLPNRLVGLAQSDDSFWVVAGKRRESSTKLKALGLDISRTFSDNTHPLLPSLQYIF